MYNSKKSSPQSNQVTRIRFWYGVLLLILAVFIVRLFYLQVIRHDYYRTVAQSTQFKEYQIPAERGVIEAKNGETTVPIVLNETLYTLYADPIYVEDVSTAATAIQAIIGGETIEYEAQLKTENTRYVVLAKQLGKDKKEALDNLAFKGIGTRGESYRTYPQGGLAATVLGFVNNEGQGRYGIEEALNEDLSGTVGEVKAITDAQGVPLIGDDSNVAIDPVPGQRTVLTIDIGLQRQVEEILASNIERTKAKDGSAIVIDVNSGSIKAMASLPSYNPAEFYTVEDASLFTNRAAAVPFEIGSIMKPLTLAAALDQGVVSSDTSYYDPGYFKIGDATVVNVEEVAGSGTRSMGDILRYSLNTGATWLLMQMGGGEINQQAREQWYDYMTNHYGFGNVTGIEQGFEATGSIPDPNEGFGLDIQYANTAFGQGMTATPLQMATALAAVLNGGTYYQPRLVDGHYQDNTYIQKDAISLRNNVVSQETSHAIKDLMQYAYSNNFRSYGMESLPEGYSIGGKTGTAQIPDPAGGYYGDRYNGTFMGYVGGTEAQYVIIASMTEPTGPGYAGTQAAGPVFAQIATSIINNFGVTSNP